MRQILRLMAVIAILFGTLGQGYALASLAITPHVASSVGRLAVAPTSVPAVTSFPELPACLHGPDPALVPMAGPRLIKYLVIHHWGGAAPASLAVAEAHFRSSGYVAPAYNVMWPASGGQWAGRSELMASAATFGLNDVSVAGCLLGDFSRTLPSDAQIAAAGAWVAGAHRRYPSAVLVQHYDAARITGHPEWATACPGDKARASRIARAIWLVACGYSVAEARRRAGAGL